MPHHPISLLDHLKPLLHHVNARRFRNNYSLFLVFFTLAATATPKQVTSQTQGAPLTLQWSSNEADILTSSVAWGDVDGDGDLDLAVGGSDSISHSGQATGAPIRIYGNNGNTLSMVATWSSVEPNAALSLAWGDVDGDGDLDLAVGNNNQPNRLYRNDSTRVFTDTHVAFTPVWSSSESGSAQSIVWGDVDGDGDLDLAVGNNNQPNRIYRNDAGVLGTTALWSSVETDATRSVTWGDSDGDGDLDLAVGNYEQPNRLYRNDSTATAITLTLVWSSTESDFTYSVAWGDLDGDNRLDLAVGNIQVNEQGYIPQPLRIYHNNGGNLATSASWSSGNLNRARSVAWGDYDGDGDLDLMVGNFSDSNALYRNDNGILTSTAAWHSAETDRTTSVTWGDVDGDGRLDVAVGNDQQPVRVYRNEQKPLLNITAISLGTSFNTESLAWGDVDGDGDLDLAAGNRGQPNTVYRNVNGALQSNGVWRSEDNDPTRSVAWGDVDGDGDLDLAAGNFCTDSDSECRSVRIYRNNGVELAHRADWSSSEISTTRSVAWGDVDGDQDLDLIVGNLGQPVELYRNDSTPDHIAFVRTWSAHLSEESYRVAWGDVDGDGDLDLAVGNYGQPNRLYRNDKGTLTADPVWSSSESDATLDLAWGDVDADGDLDLVVANNLQPIRLYRNDHGTLSNSAAWSSIDGNYSWNVAWGDVDNDGDLDLAAGSGGRPKRLYQNINGTLTPSAVWSSNEVHETLSVAWGDVDNDGDLDLAAGNQCPQGQNPCSVPAIQLYTNNRAIHTSASSVPLIRIGAANSAVPNAGQANFYAMSQPWLGPTVPITYTLVHSNSLSVREVIGEYSLDGGDNWRSAVATTDTITSNLATSPGGLVYKYTWDVLRSGVMGQSDNVIFRLKAIPSVAPRSNQIPGLYLYGAYSTATLPFRVRGNQVRVMAGDLPVPDALVYHLPAKQSGHLQPYADLAGVSFRTNSQGYLQGRDQIAPGEQLVALQPITSTESYTLFYTSAAPNDTGLGVYKVLEAGVQTLTVSSANPLIIFNLNVSLEWDARYDQQFLSRLQSDLKRTSEALYDWTNGQAALGRITIYQDKQHWDDAHIRVFATNRMRPNANQGGIVTKVITDPVSLRMTDPVSPVVTYGPGQVRIGAIWNRYGEAEGTLGDDWPRTLAHELGHYVFYLDDDYIGLNNQGLLVPVTSCQDTAMADPYRDDFSEFHPASDWLPGCAQTLSHQNTGRSDWETITTFYPQLHAPTGPLTTVNTGPSTLPLDITQITIVDPETTTTALAAPIFLLSREEDQSSYQTGRNARAFLFQHEDGPNSPVNRLVDLGKPTLDRVLARGARPGDRLCVYDLAAARLGCEEHISSANPQLPLTTVDWHPNLIITPITSTTVQLTVTQVPGNLSLKARLFPAGAPPTTEQQLEVTGNGTFTQQFTFTKPSFDGYVQVWVDESTTPRREIVSDYAFGGNPGRAWSNGVPRGDPGRAWSNGAPLISSDGQVLLYDQNLTLDEGAFFALQGTTSLPAAPPWATVVGQGYRLTANVAVPKSMSISFSYLGNDVPSGEEQGLRIYYWNEQSQSWMQLATSRNAQQNTASANVQGPGLYALMSSIELPLHGPGWDTFAYPTHATGRMSTVLQSLDGNYQTLYSYVFTDTVDPWKVYDVDVPRDWAPLVNDLQELEYGKGYWINITATGTITALLKGGSDSYSSIRGARAASVASAGSDHNNGIVVSMMPQGQAQGVPSPPATYYGIVPSGAGFRAGMTVTAKIYGIACGQAQTRELMIGGQTQIVYVIDVLADSGGTSTGCGTFGKPVTLEVQGDMEIKSFFTSWDNSRVHQVSTGALRYYLPIIQRR